MSTKKLQIVTPIVTSVNGKTGDITVATKTSELTNDSGFITEHQSLENYALKTEVPTIKVRTWTSSDFT